ncbi:MAG: DUF2961 domain-containing protein [Lysobacterales bacterium]
MLAATSAMASGLPWEVWESPARLAELDAGDQVLEVSSHCLDGCRYDRSNPGTEGDNVYPQRWLYREGAEVVVFDEPGPGAITRIWLTTGFGTSTCIDPATRVRFYIDGAVTPSLDIPLAALFDGSTPPFTPPLVAAHLDSSGGYVSYVPIAYAQSLRVALLGAENGGVNPCQPAGADPSRRLLWFQIRHHRLAPGTPVASFAAGHDEPAWRAFLEHAGDDPWNAMLVPQNATAALAPGATLALAARTGPGWLRGIRLRLPRAAYADVSLRLTFDAQAAVDVPLADFFATATDAQVPARGALVGEDASGWLYAWFPMPFTQTADAELVASSTLPSEVVVESAMSFDNAAVSAQAGTFAAQLGHSCVAAGTLAVYADRGAGKLVGMAARYRSSAEPTLEYLEGDERAYVDDAIAPAWYGTGVEDFYDAGFYFDRGAYAHPLSGATVIDADGAGTTAAYRLMPTDALVYAGALRLTQEAGPSAAEPRPMCARAVTWAYRRAQPAIVGYAGFEIGDAAAAAAHAYVPPAGADCALSGSQFEDDAATSRTAIVCAYGGGSSHFRFDVGDARAPLRLRRTFDAGVGTPGTSAGTPGATIRVNGVVVGAFAPVIANPARRWQQQEVPLTVAAGTQVFDIEIAPAFSAFAPRFSESRWELRGGWKDAIFADGFETPAALATVR